MPTDVVEFLYQQHLEQPPKDPDFEKSAEQRAEDTQLHEQYGDRPTIIRRSADDETPPLEPLQVPGSIAETRFQARGAMHAPTEKVGDEDIVIEPQAEPGTAEAQNVDELLSEIESAIGDPPKAEDHSQAGERSSRRTRAQHSYSDMQNMRGQFDPKIMATIQQKLTPKVYEMLSDDERTKTDEACKSEFAMQILDKKSIVAINFRDLDGRQRRKIYSSGMQTGRKESVTGDLLKYKARLTGGGHQHRELWDDEDRSSPTAHTASVFIVATLAAKMGRIVETIDFTGAYLNADMGLDKDGDPVIMRIDPHLVKYALEAKPEWRDFVTDKGALFVRVEKAVYGFATSGKLWYELFTDSLTKMGFKPNPEDKCVWNAVIDGEGVTIVFHVDDQMVTCKSQAVLDKIKDYFKPRFPGMTVHTGPVLEFLGMLFDFSLAGTVAVSTPGLEKSILKNIKGTSPTPADDHIFRINPDAALLPKEHAQLFYSNVQALLWMGKRTRPEILCAVSFLISRVQSPTEEDLAKLFRVLKYLNGFRGKHIRLRADDVMTVTAFVDAAYAPHDDCKSHDGVIITLGAGPIYVKSARSKLVPKSSTEAELIFLSDFSGELIWTRSFLIGQGLELGPVRTWQYNKSTILLASRGKNSSPRTKHVAVRYFFPKDRIDQGELSLSYLPTAEMVADILTKPLQGEHFRRLRALLLNMD